MTVTVKQIAGLVLLAVPAFGVLYAVNNHMNATRGLTGATRSEFVESIVELCLRKQTNDTASQRISAPLLAQYCSCYAEGMAARLSNDDWKSLTAKNKGDAMTTLQPTIDAATAPCAIELRKNTKLLPH